MTTRHMRQACVLSAIGAVLVGGVVFRMSAGPSKPDHPVDLEAGGPGSVPLQVGPSAPSAAIAGGSSLPIPDSPSGPFGSQSNPLGAPGESLAACMARKTTFSTGLKLTVTNTGFSNYCHNVPAKTGVKIQLTDEMTNSATGLTIPITIVLATPARPVVAQIAPIDSKAFPGVTVTQRPEPRVDLSQALFTSPTAPDKNPIVFDLPPLDPGHYLLQLPTAPRVPSALLVVASAVGPVDDPIFPAPTPSPDPGSIQPASLVQASAPDERALEEAFGSWERLPQTCPAVVVPGSARFARTPDGVGWAMAKFEPSPTCSYSMAPVSEGGPRRSVAPNMIGPFGRSPVGIFEQQPGGSWSMNQEGGRPFPCPAPGGVAPGPGNGSLPASVLVAWRLVYAPDCAFPTYPLQPRA